MTCLSSTTIASLEAQLAAKQAQLTLANAALSKALANGDVESYKFDSGEGSQSTKLRSLSQLQSAIEKLEADISTIERKLNGGGIVSMRVRRWGC